MLLKLQLTLQKCMIFTGVIETDNVGLFFGRESHIGFCRNDHQADHSCFPKPSLGRIGETTGGIHNADALIR